jgi:hypothetical protein
MGDVTVPITTAPGAKDEFQLLVFSDPYTFEQWRDALAAVIVAPVFVETRLLLVDRRAAQAVTLDFVDEMVRFFTNHRDALAGARTAVVTRDEAAYSMSRLIQQQARAGSPEVSIETFRSYENARIWLVGS